MLCMAYSVKNRREGEVCTVIVHRQRLTVHELHDTVVDIHIHKQGQHSARPQTKALQITKDVEQVRLGTHGLLRDGVGQPLKRAHVLGRPGVPE